MSDSPSKFERSWQLVTTSFRIIERNKKLLLFPIVSALFTLVILLFFIAPVLLIPTGQPWGAPEHWKAIVSRLGAIDPGARGSQTLVYSDTTYACVALIYLASMACATFFNVAFYSEIMKALRGNAVSVRAGIAFAFQRMGTILMWSLFAGVVGLVIRGLERRFGWFGRLVLGLVGMVWSVACVFVIPIIVVEESANPVALLRTSAATLKKTWGESLIGYVGITFASWIILFASLVLLVGGFIISTLLGHPMLMVVFGAAWFVAIFAFSYVMGVANHIFRCALFIYATEGSIPAPFTPELIEGAWKRKKE
jgi:hypothetical protein